MPSAGRHPVFHSGRVGRSTDLGWGPRTVVSAKTRTVPSKRGGWLLCGLHTDHLIACSNNKLDLRCLSLGTLRYVQVGYQKSCSKGDSRSPRKMIRDPWYLWTNLQIPHFAALLIQRRQSLPTLTAVQRKREGSWLEAVQLAN